MHMHRTDDIAAIGAVRQGLQAAENAGDHDAAVALLSEDAVLMVPDFPVQQGRAACHEFLRDVMGWLAERFERRIHYDSAEIVVDGDVAFDRGTFSFTVTPRSGGKTTHTTGKYLWILRRSEEKEGWQVSRLIVARDEEAHHGNGHEGEEVTAC
jgi:ketosteroid isomerase-like protein